MIRIILITSLSIFGLFLLIVYIWNSINRRKIRKNGRETEAEIIRIEKYSDPDKDIIYIKYKVEGTYYEGRRQKSSLSLKPGDTIRIRYQADRPGNFILAEETTMSRIIYNVIASLIFGVILFMIIYALIAPE